MNKLISIVFTVLTLAGCDSDNEKSLALCVNVENSKIETNGTGFRDVVLVSSGNEDTIGYMRNGSLVAHSECSAALVDNSISKYSWFEFGQKIENEDGVHSIKYFTNASGQLSSESEKLSLEGQWQEQVVEGDVITRQVWNNEALFDSVITVDNFDGDGIREVVIENGKLFKRKRFNPNSNQFDCSWNDDGTITTDTGCSNESNIDLQVFGAEVDSDKYLGVFDASVVNYEQDESELIDDINRYW